MGTPASGGLVNTPGVSDSIGAGVFLDNIYSSGPETTMRTTELS